MDCAAPAAAAFPVRPVSPELPERTVTSGLATPLMPSLRAVKSAEALPVVPESPELPDVAVGLAFAVELAAPVFPVLVADDWARERPEFPEMLVGDRSSLPRPPLPPLAEPEAMESPPVMAPPVTRLARPRAVKRSRPFPARSERTFRPLPPLPPLRATAPPWPPFAEPAAMESPPATLPRARRR